MKTKLGTKMMRIVLVALCGIIFYSGFALAETAGNVSAEEAATDGGMGLVKMLTSQLGVTEKQATGGAGSLFEMAKGRLSETDYGKVAGAIPGIGDLIKAAPKVSEATKQASDQVSELTKGLGSLTNAMDSAKKYAAVYEQFKKLGLDTDMVSKFIPIILSFVQSSGGETVVNILKSVWE